MAQQIADSTTTRCCMYRGVLQLAVSVICLEKDIGSCGSTALRTLTDMLEKQILALSRLAKKYAEHGRRSEVSTPDVVLAIVDTGISVQGIQQYIRRSRRIRMPPLDTEQGRPVRPSLRVGEQQKLPDEVAEGFPPLPDAHTYMRTPSYARHETDYIYMRKKIGEQKRLSERGLTRFVMRTSKPATLFAGHVDIFPLIQCRSSNKPWLVALQPQDQRFNDDDGESDSEEEGEQPDNPYLRPVKMPRRSLVTSVGRIRLRIRTDRRTDRSNVSRLEIE